MAIRTGTAEMDRALREVQTRLEKLESYVPLVILPNESVGTADTTLAHGLGRKPYTVVPAVVSPSTATVTVVSSSATTIVVKASAACTVTLVLA